MTFELLLLAFSTVFLKRFRLYHYWIHLLGFKHVLLVYISVLVKGTCSLRDNRNNLSVLSKDSSFRLCIVLCFSGWICISFVLPIFWNKIPLYLSKREPTFILAFGVYVFLLILASKWKLCLDVWLNMNTFNICYYYFSNWYYVHIHSFQVGEILWIFVGPQCIVQPRCINCVCGLLLFTNNVVLWWRHFYI